MSVRRDLEWRFNNRDSPWLFRDTLKKLLEAVPSNPVGLRDRAIILTLTLTGRRRSEILNLKASDLVHDGDAVFYSYRGKGGKQGKRELPQPAFRAIQQALEAFGRNLPP